MINSLVQSVFSFVFGALKSITSIIFIPLYNLLKEFFPDLSVFLQNSLNFIDTYIFRGIAFAREVFFNITYFPRDLMGVVVGLFLGGVALALLCSSIVFVVNIYKIYRNGDS